MNLKALVWLFFFALLTLVGKGQGLEIHKLTDKAYVFTTYKDYQGTPYPANGLYLVSDQGVALIDTPWDTTQCLPLMDSVLARHGVPVRWCISTHSHDDRTGGIDILRKQGVATYSSRQTQAICRERGECISDFGFAQDTVFQFGNLRLETFYPGAGHAPDNIVVWNAENRILHGGCLVKSTDTKGLGYLGDADVESWPIAIKAVRRKYRQPKWVIPGHKSWETTKSLKHTYRLLKKAKN